MSLEGGGATCASVGNLFRAEQLGSSASPSWGRRCIWMDIQVYVCISLCRAQAFMCSLGLGHSLHRQSTLSHSNPSPSMTPLFNFFLAVLSSVSLTPSLEVHNNHPLGSIPTWKEGSFLTFVTVWLCIYYGCPMIARQINHRVSFFFRL